MLIESDVTNKREDRNEQYFAIIRELKIDDYFEFGIRLKIETQLTFEFN